MRLADLLPRATHPAVRRALQAAWQLAAAVKPPPGSVRSQRANAGARLVRAAGDGWSLVGRTGSPVLLLVDALPGVDDDDVAVYVRRLAESEGVSGWELEALGTLVCLGDGVFVDDDGEYVNGQHRSQAMLDAGVRATVVLRWKYPAGATI